MGADQTWAWYTEAPGWCRATDSPIFSNDRFAPQTLIDGAGNSGWTPGPFQATDIANAEMDKCIRANAERVRAKPDSSALSFMVNAKTPILESQMIAL